MTTRRPYTTAGSEVVRAQDFELRPKNRPADLLRLTPGLVIAQHQGGGKAEQIFLRGFDADHGPDVALFLDDVPLNLRSHAHGQGYADEHWVIPETIEKVALMKGPYDMTVGDFATAGSVRMVTRGNFEESSLSAAGGMWATQRYVAAVGRRLGEIDVIGAFERYFTDGPFETPEGYGRWNGFAKVGRARGRLCQRARGAGREGAALDRRRLPARRTRVPRGGARRTAARGAPAAPAIGLGPQASGFVPPRDRSSTTARARRIVRSTLRKKVVPEA